ncbi:MAG: hypothetical protein KDA77_10835, partial [Planctomycetaceae bacterium]|nr:hypothetical protein [Planctomycetaceae bacterium]
MKRETRSSEIKLVLLAMLTGIGLYLVPSAYSSRVYNLVRDAARPGLILVQQIKDWEFPVAKETEEMSLVQQLETKLSETQQENRRLELQALQLSEELQRLEQTGAPDYQTQAGERLLVPDLISANILGESSIALLREGQLLNQGRAQGVLESSFVLESDLPLIDQGAAQGVKA